MTEEQTISGTDNPSDLIHESVATSPIRRWILLDGNRYILSLLLSGVVFLLVAALVVVGYIPVTQPGTATRLVAAIVGGTLPFITIVLAINQLVLSQELGWAGELDNRFKAMTSFRREVETLTETPVSPAAPADFLQLLVETVVARAESLRPTIDELDDSDLMIEMERFVAEITDEGQIVTAALEEANFGTFDALSSVLGHFKGGHLYKARRLSTEYSDELPNDACETFDELIELFRQLAVARQMFKTLYIQHELAHLSKLLLYVGFPTLLGGGIFLLTYGSVIDTVDSPLLLLFIVSTVVTLVFLPLIVLLASTLRIATIASRTADFGPFVPRAEFE